MRIPKIYLETTMFNHYFDTNRDAHADTKILFKEIQSGRYEAYTSAYAVDELNKASEPKRNNMLSLITEYNIVVLDYDYDYYDEVERLTDIYVSEA